MSILMDNKTKISQMLKASNGMTIEELARNAEVSRITVMITLAELKGEQKIDIKKVGQAKLHTWRRT